MYFILTTKDEEELQSFLRPHSYKFMDFDKLQRDFDASLRDPSTIYYDYHLNEYITTKLLNSFKNYKSHYFVYRLNSYEISTVENLYNFIIGKYSTKFDQIIIVGDTIDKKTIKAYEKLNVDYIDLSTY